MTSMTISQMRAPIPTAAPVAPALDQKAPADNPKPVPRASKINDKATATKAPATTAPHDTPEAFASAGYELLSNSENELTGTGLGIGRRPPLVMSLASNGQTAIRGST